MKDQSLSNWSMNVVSGRPRLSVYHVLVPKKYLVNFIPASPTVATKPQPRSHIRTEIEKRMRFRFSARNVVPISAEVNE